jgi:hypothetical protein
MGTGTAVAAMAMVLALLGCADRSPSGTEGQEHRYATAVPPLGEPVAFNLVTHCGVEFAQIGGELWYAEDLPPKLAGGRAPEGWDNPMQAGELVVHGPGRAVFAARGTRITFLRAEDGAQVPDCR